MVGKEKKGYQERGELQCLKMNSHVGGWQMGPVGRSSQKDEGKGQKVAVGQCPRV